MDNISFEQKLDRIIEIINNKKNPNNKNTYPKLVRDNVPDIILETNPCGTTVTYKKLNGEKFKKALIDKLIEEVLEYIESDDVEELGDILEVVYALGKTHHETEITLNNIRNYKSFVNGKFKKRLYLESVESGKLYEDPKDTLEEDVVE